MPSAHTASWFALGTGLLLAACGDDDTRGDRDVAATDTATDTAISGCAFKGTWNLQTVRCGDDDITADWFRVIDRTTLVLSDDGVGCASESTNETDACKETERGTMFATTGDTWSVASQGIASCTPASCTFGPQDAPCTLGDRAASYEATFTLADGKLSMTSARGICAGLGANAPTTFVFEPR